ncbi:hypothetical protein [Mesonia phycicola]|nr:hypothetical protein [Mesonia phycicola]
MKLLSFFILFIASCSIKAQPATISLIEKTPFNLQEFVGVDKFNNFYGITNNTFFKLEGAKKYQFTDFLLGELTSVDLLNPLKITLFYKNMNTVVILDNRLNEIYRINFTNITNFRNVSFASTGKDKSIWIYNTDIQQLELFNYNSKKVISHTQPINSEIIQLKSNYNFCWLLQNKKLELYNSYGSFIKAIQVPENFEFVENNNQIIGRNNNKWFVLRKDKPALEPLTISENDVKDFYLNNENLYLYIDNFIYRYQLNLSNE